MVAGNWKMNTTVPQGLELAGTLVNDLRDMAGGAEVVLIPPFTHLVPMRELLAPTHIRLGAQNCYLQNKGAYTGEISPQMLVNLCDYVLLGHSERRNLMGETDEMVGAKLQVALSAGLRVILAVGENESERESGTTLAVVDRQLQAALADAPGCNADNLIVAYEPVWAIGTGKTATPEQAEKVCAHIASRLGGLAGSGRAVRILYGGSVTAENADSLFAQEHLDGALVGGASLNAGAFAGIVASCGQRLSRV